MNPDKTDSAPVQNAQKKKRSRIRRLLLIACGILALCAVLAEDEGGYVLAADNGQLQLHINPKAEICAYKGTEWVRIAGELIEDDRREARVAMLEAYPSLQGMYNADDGNTEVFYLKDATATFSSFGGAPEVVKL